MKYNGQQLRHELKYIITYPQYYQLLARLKVFMRKDGDFEEGYLVRSLYFDDMYNTAYYQKEAGVFRRCKYRIRIYNNCHDGVIKLEKKSKISEYIKKTDENITPDEFYALLDGRPEFLLEGTPIMQDWYAAMRTKLLSPAVVVDYLRDAYICTEGNVRITFDKNLRAGLDFDILNPDLPTVRAMQEGVLVMEVKFDDFLPKHIKTLIQPASSDHMAVSKYILCRKAKDLYQRKDFLP